MEYFQFYLLVAVLLPLVAYAPGVAIIPRTYWNAYTLSVAPVVSVGLLALLAALYKSLGVSSSAFYWLPLLIALVISLLKWRRCPDSIVDQHFKFYVLINFLIILPLLAIAMRSAMNINDEIVSWHIWAIKHYQGIELDFHSIAPYPQLAPYFVAYCYHLFGSIELQAVVKGILCVVPFTVLNLLASVVHRRQAVIAYLVLVWCGFFGANEFYKFYTMIYGEPLMVAALLASAVGLYHFYRQGRVFDLIIAAVSASIAVMGKQPAMIWALFTFPLLSIIFTKVAKHNLTLWQHVVVILLSVLPVIFWLLGPGYGFENNSGVLNASMAQRNYVQQLIHATHWFYDYQWWFTAIYALTIFVVIRSKTAIFSRYVFLLYVLPGTIIWMLFNNYDYRGALPVITVMTLLLLLQVNRLSWVHMAPTWLPRALAGISAIGFIVLNVQNAHYKYPVKPFAAGLTTSSKFLGNAGGQWFYQHVYQNERALNVTADNSYACGMINLQQNCNYKSFRVSTQPLAQLAEEQTDILITSERYNKNMAQQIKQEAIQCNAFTKVVDEQAKGNKYHFAVYKINQEALKQCLAVS